MDLPELWVSDGRAAQVIRTPREDLDVLDLVRRGVPLHAIEDELDRRDNLPAAERGDDA